MTATDDITGLVLCGGRGLRMGGVDKGLQRFRGLPLALHQLLRLQRQTGACMINANRHLAAYAAFGVPVWPDGLAGHAGPLAGFLAGLEHCRTRWLLTVPCDTPLFPPDLATRLAAAVDRQGADIAMAAAPEVDGAGQTRLRPQPVFCLLRVPLQQSLRAFTAAGGRKIGAWAAQQHCASVPFDQPGDDPLAFVNINTWAQLRALDGSTAPAVPAPSPVPSPAPSEDGAAVPGPERV